MGNSGSAQQQTLVEGPPHSWAHSFPRTSSFKVLPDRVPGQRLRLTDNGAILNNGGTISGRKPYVFEPQIQSYRNTGFSNGQDYRRTLFGSEPDLRFSGVTKQNQPTPVNNQSYYNGNNDSSAKSRIGRSRKKYKAPPAPQNNNSADSSSPDSYRWETSADSSDVTTPSRKSRLFKTRAETKRPSLDNNVNANQVSNQLQTSVKPGAFPGQLHRSLSSPQFQDELIAKLRERSTELNAKQLRGVREPPVGKAADSPRSSPILRSTEPLSKQKMPPVNRENRNRVDKPVAKQKSDGRLMNGHRLKKETEVKKVAPVQQRPKKEEEIKKPEKSSTPVKKFYFGMEAGTEPKPPSPVIDESTEVIDKFAESLRKSRPLLSNTSTSESFSSEPTNDDSSAGISLKLRPTLPRKQLDIPRFSPTAAWRLLSALESPVHSEEDDLVLVEDQIPHPRVDHHLHHHQLTDKSGDSGISGDASPQHQDSAHNSQIAWTPQQDLEETSSDGGLDSAPVSPESIGTAKFSPRFSLSLPRDERVPVYPYPDKIPSDVLPNSSFQNLKKLKRSVSGALGRGKEVAVSSLDENWLLSRSVPNLFHNSRTQRWSNSSPSSGEQDDEQAHSLSKPSSFSYLANGGHIMYLPEYKTSKQRERKIPNGVPLSKSCEDLSRHRSSETTTNHNIRNGRSKNRKFTFQSTIRQIERKKIAEKLSKEAEEKEKQRLRELEAMKKVEEEFQKKREREKADIRQQLRLYNLTEGGREQPDGAVVPSPPTTQILSEFRQPRREYRDYTPIRSDLDSISHSDSVSKKETVHPEVVYKMPKNAHVYVSSHHPNNGNGSGHHTRVDSPKSSSSDNYRKNFAQGALPHSVVSSDSEVSQPNTRPTSRIKHRSRSQSPEYECPEDVKDTQTPDEDDLEDSKNNSDSLKVPVFKTITSNKIAPQPFNRNQSYKPVVFNPFSDKIAQVTS